MSKLDLSLPNGDLLAVILFVLSSALSVVLSTSVKCAFTLNTLTADVLALPIVHKVRATSMSKTAIALVLAVIAGIGSDIWQRPANFSPASSAKIIQEPIVVEPCRGHVRIEDSVFDHSDIAIKTGGNPCLVAKRNTFIGNRVAVDETRY